jgi:alpha-beta hydrolase superfamily lysophospholipase
MIGRYEAELPLYFGPDGELFGLFHAPTTPASKAVLLCPPLGQEQIRCHRLYRQLAHALAAEGVAVLRFDYYGSGDSAGASVDVDWDRCVADTIVAANELRVRSGTDRVLAFGARLGGSIALAAAEAARFAGLMVWDPVCDGAAYVARLDSMQAALAVDTQRFIKPRLAADAAAQWLGFAVSDRLRRQLVELQPEPPHAPMLVLDSLAATATTGGHGLMADPATVVTLQPPTPWDDLHRLELAILSHPLIRSVAGHLREVA